MNESLSEGTVYDSIMVVDNFSIIKPVITVYRYDVKGTK
jgi:hypothetical protein